jgi:hypothetical protein
MMASLETEPVYDFSGTNSEKIDKLVITVV